MDGSLNPTMLEVDASSRPKWKLEAPISLAKDSMW